MDTKPTTKPKSRVRRWLRPWWAKALALLLLAGIGFGVYRLVVPAPPPPAPASSDAVLADITQLVQAAGVLQPRVKVDVGAQVSGQVQKIHVQLGQQVKKGDLLVSLDPELARSDVAQAEAAVAQQAALIESLQASLKLARREAERQQRLLRGEATAATESERADTELAKLEADLRGQSATLKRLQAELTTRQLRLGYTTITAPMSGLLASDARSRASSTARSERSVSTRPSACRASARLSLPAPQPTSTVRPSGRPCSFSKRVSGVCSVAVFTNARKPSSVVARRGVPPCSSGRVKSSSNRRCVVTPRRRAQRSTVASVLGEQSASSASALISAVRCSAT